MLAIGYLIPDPARPQTGALSNSQTPLAQTTSAHLRSTPVVERRRASSESAVNSALLERLEKQADTDVARAFSELQTAALPQQLRSLKDALARRILKKDPNRLPEVLRFIEDTADRNEIIHVAVEKALATLGAGAIDTVESQLAGANRTSALASSIGQFLAQSGADAATAKVALERMPASEQRKHLISFIAQGYAARDLDQFFRFLDAMPGEAPDAIRHAEAMLRVKGDVEGLERLLPRIPESAAERNNIIQSIVSARIQRKDPAGVRGFVNTLQGKEREIAEGALLLADVNLPVDRAVAVASNFKDKDAARYLITSAVDLQFYKDPRLAAAAVAAMPDAAAEYAVGNLVGRWHRVDPAQVNEWIGSLPSGRRRDLALKRLVVCVMPKDRGAARRAAAAISDPKLREQILRSVGPFSR
ncbi:MAG: hypothetical protein M3463_13350 [Verrucomicrobiota bacterium]|nr:hypothetical protein [Verrucomicrobiota bacterium]